MIISKDLLELFEDTWFGISTEVEILDGQILEREAKKRVITAENDISMNVC